MEAKLVTVKSHREVTVVTRRYSGMTSEQAIERFVERTGQRPETFYILPNGDIAIPFIAEVEVFDYGQIG